MAERSLWEDTDWVLLSGTPHRIARSQHGDYAAHQPDRIATVRLLDRAISHCDSRAKHAAARVKQSRSLRNSRFSRVSVARSSSSTRKVAGVVPCGWARRCPLTQRYRTLSGMPSSRAICATGRLESLTKRTASVLNAVYCRRVDAGMMTSNFTSIPLMGMSVKVGEVHTTSPTESLLDLTPTQWHGAINFIWYRVCTMIER
jgi:hypothetical protein